MSANSMTIDISIGTGWWRYILEKEAAAGEDASLSDLQIDGSTIEGFSPSMLNYTYGIPDGTPGVPQITSAVPTDPDVSGLEITQATGVPGVATVEVTSANGNVSLTYTVSYVYTFDLYLPVTFEENIDYGLLDFEGTISEIVEDPTDPSNTVAKTIKTNVAAPWAGTTIGGTTGFAEAVPFAEGSTTMTVRVWSPDANTPVRLKVEDADDDTHTVETETNTTLAGEWETLIFDFANEAPGTEPINYNWYFNKATIFFNFGTEGSVAGEKTYYWDDVEFTGSGVEPKPLMAADVQDNFEDDGWGTIPEWKFQDPDLGELPIIIDPLNSANHAADYIRSGTFEWTNAQFILEHRMDLSVRNVFQLKVLFPSSNDYSGSLAPIAAIKLQNSLLGGDAWTTQTEVIDTVYVFDEWVTLEFDFSAVSDREDYDQVVVQFGGEGHFVPGQFHFDDLMLLDEDTSIDEKALSQLSISPNPASGIVNIADFRQLATLVVYNMSGQKVLSFNVVPQQLSVSDLPMGVYTIMATGINGENYNSKLIVR
jgi:hypothetical protein